MKRGAAALAISLSGLLLGCDAHYSGEVSVSIPPASSKARATTINEVGSVVRSALRELGLEPGPGSNDEKDWFLTPGGVHVEIVMADGTVRAKIEQVYSFGHGPPEIFRRIRDTLKERLQARFGVDAVTVT